MDNSNIRNRASDIIRNCIYRFKRLNHKAKRILSLLLCCLRFSAGNVYRAYVKFIGIENEIVIMVMLLRYYGTRNQRYF